MNHTFDWQKEDRGYNGSFLGWLLPHLFVFAKDDAIGRASDKSERFTKTEIGITVNGEEIDAKKFLEDLERVIMSEAKSEAKEMLAALDNLSEIRREIDRLGEIVRIGVDEAASTLGIEVSSWD